IFVQDGNQIRTLYGDGTSSSFAVDPDFRFSNDPIQLVDPKGDSTLALLTEGRSTQFFGARRLYLLSTSGSELLNVPLTDGNNTSNGLTRYLMGDLDGDGQKEILVQDFPSSGFSLKLLDLAGNKKPWADPTYTGFNSGMAAADL